jgi:cardiolipin synthase
MRKNPITANCFEAACASAATASAFLHAKHATIDRDIAWIGSSNMDIDRSRSIPKVVLLAYDHGVCAALSEVQERYFREGEWLDADAWDAQPLYRQVGWNLARMFSSVL